MSHQDLQTTWKTSEHFSRLPFYSQYSRYSVLSEFRTNTPLLWVPCRTRSRCISETCEGERQRVLVSSLIVNRANKTSTVTMTTGQHECALQGEKILLELLKVHRFVPLRELMKNPVKGTWVPACPGLSYLILIIICIKSASGGWMDRLIDKECCFMSGMK